MRLAVLKERRASETRVAATPDTVKRLIALGLTVAVETGAGADAAIPDRRIRRRRRRDRRRMPADALAGAEIVFAVQMPLPEQRALIPRGALLVCTASAFAEPDAGAGARTGRHRLRRDGTAAAHHPRAGDGRAVEPGQPRRLSRCDRSSRRVPARLPDDDDRGRHGAAGPRCSSSAPASPGCRRSPPPGGSAPSSPRPTCVPPPRRRSSRSAAPSSASRMRKPPARPAPMPAK